MSMNIVLKFLPYLIPLALIAVGVVSFLLSDTYYKSAKTVNDNIEEAAGIIGSQNGQLVGMVNGTYEGITQGWAQGASDGKVAGLRAEDTTAEIKGKITSIGKLDILHISENHYIVHKYGGEGNEIKEESDDVKYAELQRAYADIIYWVDLSKVVVELKAEQLIVQIPLPEVDIAVDSSRTETIETYEAPLFNGKTEDGITAAINSREQIQKELEEQFNNPDRGEYKNAKDLAKTHVEQLVQSIRINSEAVTVNVIYLDEQAVEES